MYVNSYVEGCICTQKCVLFWQSSCVPWWKLLHCCFIAVLRHLKSSEIFLLVYIILFASFKALAWANQKYLLLVQCLAVHWPDRLSAPSAHTVSQVTFLQVTWSVLSLFVNPPASLQFQSFFHSFYSIPLSLMSIFFYKLKVNVLTILNVQDDSVLCGYLDSFSYVPLTCFSRKEICLFNTGC